MVEGNNLKVAMFTCVVVGALYLLSTSVEPKKARTKVINHDPPPPPEPAPKLAADLTGGQNGGGAPDPNPKQPEGDVP